MAELIANPRVMKRSPLEIGIDRIWRFFTSVRAAIYEVSFLTLLVLLGTLRGSSVPNTIKSWAPFTAPVIKRWYAWNVFHSFPFMFILALLSVAITICTANRAPGMWKTIAEPTVTTTRGFLTTAGINGTFALREPQDEAVGRVVGVLRKRRYRVLTEVKDGDTHVYADRFRFAKLGTYPFHLALIMILVGGIVGAKYGFRDTSFIIPDGSTRDIGHGTGLTVKLNHFSDVYRQDGSPAEYRSDLVVYDHGSQVKTGSITVNHPLTYKNVVIYQSSFGQAVSLHIADAAGHVLYDDAIPLGLYTAANNPNAPAGILDLPEANAEIRVIAPDNAPSATSTNALNVADGEMFIQVRPKNVLTNTVMPSAIVGQGETANLDGLNITFVRERQFSLFQVARNPGIPIFWAAAFMLVGGLVVVFYFPHRRVRGIISSTSETGPTTAFFAPLAKRDWSGKRAFELLVQDFEAKLDVKALIRTREDQDDDARPEPALTAAS